MKGDRSNQRNKSETWSGNQLWGRDKQPCRVVARYTGLLSISIESKFFNFQASDSIRVTETKLVGLDLKGIELFVQTLKEIVKTPEENGLGLSEPKEKEKVGHELSSLMVGEITGTSGSKDDEECTMIRDRTNEEDTTRQLSISSELLSLDIEMMETESQVLASKGSGFELFTAIRMTRESIKSFEVIDIAEVEGTKYPVFLAYAKEDMDAVFACDYPYVLVLKLHIGVGWFGDLHHHISALGVWQCGQRPFL
ncbi:hypothetical protein DM860_005230 [Cuscuta australis]|uniref:Uncharacterized protein n=1 Tax=Cuscuta australis TaxID=267555 RepID=A0A328DYR0_9ASTE|nr:hypothetical protein DM860_005230 [Cuscuta australis]